MSKVGVILGCVFFIFTPNCTYEKNEISDLPKPAQEFIADHFSTYELDDIYFYNRHDEMIEVEFEDNTSIYFFPDGKWQQVIGGLKEVPETFLPGKIVHYIHQHYPDTYITEVEKDKDEIDIDLSNSLELEFTEEGKFKKID